MVCCRAMHAQLLALRNVVQLLDPAMHAFMEEKSCLNYFFCYRWLLIHFKREFAFEEVRLSSPGCCCMASGVLAQLPFLKRLIDWLAALPAYQTSSVPCQLANQVLKYASHCIAVLLSGLPSFLHLPLALRQHHTAAFVDTHSYALSRVESNTSAASENSIGLI